MGGSWYHAAMSETSRASPTATLVHVEADQAGQRIDNFLLAALKGVPKSHVYRILRTGQVRVNGGRSKASRKLEAGDTVRMPPVRTAVSGESPALNIEGFRRRIEGRILLEDNDLIVIDKPAGVAVHGGSGLALGIIEGLRLLPDAPRYLELVHRLDRDTSGCLVIAKKRSALRALHEQFRGNAVDKSYLALLCGNWSERSRVVDVPLEKNVLQSGERLVKASTRGKPARTRFSRVQCYARWTLVNAEPETGRTHQIRVHAGSLGFPIAGDERYSSSAWLQEARSVGLRRLFLHAARLEFLHPADGRPVAVEAPLGPDLQRIIDHLE